jgi:hemin uptake protein HemP
MKPMNDGTGNSTGRVVAAGSTPPTPSRVRSEALLGQTKELVIVHNGREYRLRVTQNGRLILTA